jgi:hypothetical protein
MVGGQKRRGLKQYQRDFYAHNAAASKAVINDTNDAPQHTRNVQQRKHSSFEIGPRGRLNISSSYYTVPSSPGKRRRGESDVPLDITELNFSIIDDFSDNFQVQSDTPELVEFTKPKCTGGEVLRLWQSDADLFLEEFLRLEGRGDYSQDICVCGKEAATYRCQDCHGCELFCRLCMIRTHERHPLHRIEVCVYIPYIPYID